MTSQPGKYTVVIHILPKISRSKGNQTIKFGDGDTIPRPFSKKSKLNISLDQSKVYTVCFHCMLR